MPNLIERAKSAIKAFRQPESGASGWSYWPHYHDRRFYWEPNTNIDYAELVGDLWTNSAIQACLNWLLRAWPESYPCVKQKDQKGKKTRIDDHPLYYLLEAPNPGYDDTVLWAGTILSFWTDGNAYWGINRNGMLEPTEFVYLPHNNVTPKREKDSTNPGPDYYEYNLGGKVDKIRVEDIVHYRFGMDPRNSLLGMSAWASVNRHVYTDNEAAAYQAVTLKNRGAPWVILTPDGEGAGFGSDEEYKSAVARLNAKTQGDERGGIALIDSALKAIFPPSMKEQGISDIHKIPETRICSLAGIPPIVLGLASGLERSTFENTEQGEAAAWRTIVAVQRMMGRQGTQQLMRRPGKNFYDESRTFFMGFDYSEVRALEEDKNAEHERVRKDFEAGLLTEDEAREEIGREAFTPDQRQEMLDRATEKMEAATPPEPADDDERNLRAKSYKERIEQMRRDRPEHPMMKELRDKYGRTEEERRSTLKAWFGPNGDKDE